MFKWILLFILIIEGEQILEFVINNNFLIQNNKEKSNEIDKKWIGPLSHLFNNMVFVLDHLVSLYFFTFNNCFSNALCTLNSLIYGYFHLLEILIITFLHFPTNIICILGLYIALMFSYKIVKCIFVR